MANLKKPPFFFLLLGTLVYFLHATVLQTAPADVVVDPDDLRSATEAYFRQTGIAPSQLIVQQLKQRLLDEQILYQEALSRNLHFTDNLIKNRLQSVITFLEVSSGSSEKDLAKAYQWQLYLHDEVIRRRLVDLMKQQLIDEQKLIVPSSKALQTYYEENRELYRRQQTISFEQLYFSTVETGLSKAQCGNMAFRDRASFFMHGNRFSKVNRRTVETLFGYDFSNAIFNPDENEQWLPLQSAFGFHCVYIHEIDNTAADSYFRFEEVEPDVVERVKEIQQREALLTKLQALRKKYRVGR
ncbi:MAG: peptidyl-prolyl cis-trans isomerase [Pseudomonadales bacterium]|nr:peptidyl-prolyl cis-trans isomerase [Pseudomonadales bacterium]